MRPRTTSDVSKLCVRCTESPTSGPATDVRERLRSSRVAPRLRNARGGRPREHVGGQRGRRAPRRQPLEMPPRTTDSDGLVTSGTSASVAARMAATRASPLCVMGRGAPRSRRLATKPKVSAPPSNTSGGNHRYLPRNRPAARGRHARGDAGTTRARTSARAPTRLPRPPPARLRGGRGDRARVLAAGRRSGLPARRGRGGQRVAHVSSRATSPASKEEATGARRGPCRRTPGATTTSASSRSRAEPQSSRRRCFR